MADYGRLPRFIIRSLPLVGPFPALNPQHYAEWRYSRSLTTGYRTVIGRRALSELAG